MGGDIFPVGSSSGSVGSSGAGGAPVMCDNDPKTDGAPVWSKASAGSGGEYVYSVALDPSGNIYVAGGFTGTVNFGGAALTSADAATDVFLLKLDPTGKHLWSKSFSGPNSQSAKGVAVDANGNVYITGFYLGSIDLGGGAFTKKGCCFEDVFLAKYDTNGNHIWSKGFGDIDADNVTSIAVDPAGNPIITGFFQSVINFGGGNLMAPAGGATDIYVAKFDPAGAHIWSKNFGDASDQSPNAVTVDAQGNLLLTGEVKGSADFGGGKLTAAGANNGAFLVKLSSSGAHVWSHLFGDGATGVAVDTNAAGDVVFVGDYKNKIDLGGGEMMAKANENGFVGRFDAAGKYVWGITFEASASHATSVGFAAKDKIVVGGYFSGGVDLGKKPGIASAGGFDGFIVKLDSASCHVWSRGFGDMVVQKALGLVIDASDNAILVGDFAGTADLGTGALTASGDDIFIAKYAP